MKRIITQFVIVAAMLVGSGLVSWHLYNLDEARIYETFEQDINKRAYALEFELARSKSTLRHWKKFYETVGDIDPYQFSEVAKDTLGNYPSLQVLAWAPMVLVFQKDAFEKKTGEWKPNFVINELIDEAFQAGELESDVRIKRAISSVSESVLRPVGMRPIYFPITVLEPMSMERSGVSVGLDLMSISQFSFDSKLMDSITTGSIVGSPSIPSPFASDRKPIFIALAPVQAEKNAYVDIPGLIKGFIAAVFDIEKLLNQSSLLHLSDDVNFKLVDETGDEGLRQLFSTQGYSAVQGVEYTRPVAGAFGRNWVINAAPTAGYISARRSVFPQLVVISGIVGTLLMFLYVNILHRQVRSRTQELQNANMKLAEISRIDALTEVANRRCFNENLESEWNRSLRDETSLSLLLIDVDYFKNYNDRYGHLEGDKCLIEVAQKIKSIFCRSGDLVARYGGEEFAIITRMGRDDVMAIAAKCCESIECLNIEHLDSDVSGAVTISVGVSSVTPAPELYPELLLDCADKGLYFSKENGRNQVNYHDCPVPIPKPGSEQAAFQSRPIQH